MKLKKLLATVLSVASVISMLPMTMQTASAADEEKIQKDPNANYLFWEDFEGDTYNTIFDTSSTNTRWTSEVVDGKMVYTVDGTKTNTDTGASRTMLSGGTYASIDINTTYEVGWKFNMSDNNSYMWFAPFALGNKWTKLGGPSFLMNASGSQFSLRDVNAGQTGVTVKDGDGTGDITVRIVFNVQGNGKDVATAWSANGTPSKYNNGTTLKNGDALVYISYENDNGPVELELDWDFASTTHNAVYLLDNVQMGTMVEQSMSASANGSITLDYFYLKEVDVAEVTFNYEDGETEAEVIKADLHNNVTAPTPENRDTDGDGDIDYVFDGWYYENGDEFDGEGLEGEHEVYAKWLDNYTVYFNSVGGSDVDPIDTTTGEIELPDDPTMEYKVFDGWYLEESYETEFDETDISEDMTVYAKWTDAYKVTFDVQGGPNEVKAQYTDDKLTKLPEAVWLGYQFDGWVTEDGSEFDGSLPDPKEDITVYATWTKKWIVNFEVYDGDDIDLNDGEDLNTLYILRDLTSDELPTTKKKGGQLVGWYWDEKFQKPFDGTGLSAYMKGLEDKEVTIYAKYNDVLFFEDFENTDGVDYMKQLSPDGYKSFINQGGGIVEDDKGNHYFHIAGESGKAITIADFDVMESGLYEISFKAMLKNQSFYGAVGTPVYVDEGGGKNAWCEPYFYGNQYIVPVTDNPRLSIFNTTSTKPADFVDFVYRYDTSKKTISVYASWVDINGKKQTASIENRSFTTAYPEVNAFYLAKISTNSGLLYTYIDDVCLRKVDLPKIEATTPSENETDVSLKPTVQVTFDRTMDRSTLIPENLYVTDADGNILDAKVTAATVDGKTVATIALSEQLEYDSNYNIVATVAISDGDYFLEKEYQIPFTTEPEKYQAEVTLTTSAGVEITDLTDVKNKAVKVKVNFRNYAGKETEDVFVTVAVVDTETGVQQNCRIAKATVSRTGEMTEVFNSSIIIPSTATSNYKVEVFIWDQAGFGNILYNKIMLP